MDDIEKAQEREMLDRALALFQAQKRQAHSVSHMGECHACGEPVEAPKLFCGRECAEHYELLKRRGQ